MTFFICHVWRPIIIEQQHNKGAFSSIANTFATRLSDIALNSVRPDSQGLHLRYPRYDEDPDTG